MTSFFLDSIWIVWIKHAELIATNDLMTGLSSLLSDRWRVVSCRHYKVYRTEVTGSTDSLVSRVNLSNSFIYGKTHRIRTKARQKVCVLLILIIFNSGNPLDCHELLSLPMPFGIWLGIRNCPFPGVSVSWLRLYWKTRKF